MNCKHCGAEVEESAKICPACGENLETKEKVSVGKIIAATAVCVVLLVLLAVMVIYGITGKLPYLDKLVSSEPTGEATNTTPPAGTVQELTAADLGMAIENITDFSGLFVDDEEMKNAGDRVVAKVGEYELTNNVLQVSFWMEVYSFVNNNASYLSYYGLDLSKPLDQQIITGSVITWEQYFLDMGIEAWQRYAVVNMLAEKAEFQPGEDLEKNMSGSMSTLESLAKEGEFASVEEMLIADMGVGATVEAYEEYMRLYYTAMAYAEHVYENAELTREEVEAYFDKHSAEILSQYGISKNTGMLVDVRHVLIQPEGATTDSSGYIVATDEQWEACRVEGQKLLDDWVAAGATEEGFAELAKEHSVDPGSTANGGLYQGVSAGQMVKNFNDWLFEEERKAGDYGLVRTEFGYHLMYYVGGDHAWYIYGKDLARSGILNDMVAQALEENALEVHLENVVLSMAKSLVEEAVPETSAPAATGAAN